MTFICKHRVFWRVQTRSVCPLTRRGLPTPRYQIYLVVDTAVGVVSGFIGFNVVGLNTSVWAAYGLREHLIPTVLPALLLLPTAFLILALKIRDHRATNIRATKTYA